MLMFEVAELFLEKKKHLELFLSDLIWQIVPNS